MKFDNMAEVRRFLSKFGTFIYMGNEEEDEILIEMEIEDLQEMGIISREEELALRFALSKSKRDRSERARKTTELPERSEEQVKGEC